MYRELHGDPVRLPPAFRIYSHDCPRHRPIYALCGSEEGAWTRTEIIAPNDDAEGQFGVRSTVYTLLF